MKPLHIIGLIGIALAIAMIVTTLGDASRYVSFDEACTMAKNGNKTKIHVVGTLRKNKQGIATNVYYDAVKDPNYFKFTLIDNNKKEFPVVYRNPKPADFERSEQVVVVGNMVGEEFHAKDILMKCPSKYEEKEVKM
ncbi:MAG: cytochrome c maturation protein CcmE [Bacteroidetes bacterium]|nr:MAG: cytochrome c maturation protein CcmE [Bacteroidota bacterium]